MTPTSFPGYHLLCLLLILMASSALAQKPFKPAEPHFDPKQPIPRIGCALSNGKPRKYACEFILTKFEAINNPQSVLKQLGWGKKSVTLLLSKAKSTQDLVVSGKSLRFYIFDLELTFLRIAPPAKSVQTYVLTLVPRAKGAANTFLSDLALPSGPVKPENWLANAEPALSIPVGQEQKVKFPLRLLVDPSASGGPRIIINPDADITTSAPSMDLRMYLHNMATTYALHTGGSGYKEARDFAEWAASIELSVKP